MEPITVKSKLDFKTYLKINFGVYFSVRLLVVVLVVLGIMNAVSFWAGGVNWEAEWIFIGFLVVMYGGFMPLFIYFGAKKNIKSAPIVSESVTYMISDEHVVYETPTASGKTTWKFMTKAIEKDDYFLLFSSNRLFRYLPKAGFESPNDMEKFKDMVKANNIKAYFK